MKKSLLPIISISIVSLCAQAVLAKTPAVLKTDMASIMPSGKKARMVWAQGTPSSYGSGNAQVWGFDSDDGVVKQISSGTLNADWPCLSKDGSRVFFFDNKSGEVKIVSFSGGTMTNLNANHVSGDEISMESWVDPGNGSDWVVIGGVAGGQVGRINVDNPSQTVSLWTCGSPCPSYGDGIALSLDGTHLGAMWDLNGNFASGVGDISAKTVKRHTTWIGCGVSMPADNSYRVSFADQEIRLSTGVLPYTAVPAVARAVSSTTNSNCMEWFEMSSHRWTNDPDYLSVCLYSSNKNPFLYKVSTDKIIAIKDDLGCNWVGHPDVCFTASATSAKISIPDAQSRSLGASSASQTVYSIDGRLLNGSSLSIKATRLVIRRVGNEGTASLRAVVAAR